MLFSPPIMFPRSWSFEPIGFEGFEGTIIEGLRRKGHAERRPASRRRRILLVEFGSDDAEQAQNLALQLIDRLKQVPDPPAMRLYTNSEAPHRLESARKWTARGRLCSRAPPQWEGWDDAAVAPEKLGGYLRDIRNCSTSTTTRAPSTDISGTDAFTCA